MSSSLPLRLERWWHDNTRHKDAHPKVTLLCLAVGFVVLLCLPLAVVWSASFEEAEVICKATLFAGVNDEIAAGNLTPEEGQNMEGNATYDLQPQHYFNSLSAAVSVFCYSIWLFFSPHVASTRGYVLDRLRE